MAQQATGLRADAQRNRERIVVAATEAFASGGSPSLDSIARQAGVGSGTLYRHFPTREDLVEAVYRDQVRPLRDEAERLRAEQAPVDALLSWMTAFADWAADREGIMETLVAMSTTGRFGTGPVCDEVLSIITALMEDGVASGDLRDDVDPLDVSALLAGALSVARRNASDSRLDVLLALMCDALHADPAP